MTRWSLQCPFLLLHRPHRFRRRLKTPKRCFNDLSSFKKCKEAKIRIRLFLHSSPVRPLKKCPKNLDRCLRNSFNGRKGNSVKNSTAGASPSIGQEERVHNATPFGDDFRLDLDRAELTRSHQVRNIHAAAGNIIDQLAALGANANNLAGLP